MPPIVAHKSADRNKVTQVTTFHNFSALTLTGETQDFADYRGRCLLVVNTASKCGLTPQFEGLERLWQEFGPERFTILGFPCNQFAHQEPHDEAGIGEFCQVNYGVTFPMFSKIEVNGPNTHPAWAWLKAERPGLFGGTIKWNFTKFLVGPDGDVLQRYAPQRKPETMIKDIQSALAG